MKPHKSLLFLFLGTFGMVQLQGQALLWEISGKNLKEKSYLFGSIHIQDRRVFELDSMVWEKFEKASSFALEFDVEHIDPYEWANRILMEQSYTELLSEEDYSLLGRILQRHTEVNFLQAQRMKPFFISTLISQSVLPKDHKDPLDLFLLKKARSAKKTILELESFGEQMNIVDSFPFQEQLDALLKLIHDPDWKANLTAESEKMIETYLSQDDTQLYKLILESEGSETFMKDFLIKRNHNMVEKIQTFVSNGSVFITVGAGHLAGDEGLVNLLKKAGYTLTPIKYNGK